MIHARAYPAMRRLLRTVRRLGALAVCAAAAHAAPIDLADQPLFSTVSVPGNLILALSVEWPTATTPAYPSTTAYSASSTFLGYFDPAKCYRYVYSSTTPSSSYFTPDSAATSHACTTTSSKALWSGNYLNWSSMQTLDAFRWVLTGGYRSTDTTSATILTKTYAAQDTTVMPHKTTTSGVSGATPFTWNASSTKLRAIGTQMYVTGAASFDCSTMTTATNGTVSFSCNSGATVLSCSYSGSSTSCTQSISGGQTLSCARTGSSSAYTYTCNTLNSSNAIKSQCVGSGSGTNATSCKAATSGTYTVVDYNAQSSAAATADAAAIYRVYVNVKVCDSTVGLESNCVAYGNTAAKPEGLMQSYSSKLRYSAFGYYNDGNINRDGGVMRARMKYIGPTRPVPGSTAVTNSNTEWDATTGIMATNPDPTDATATQALASAAGWSVTIPNSGVMNYLNKFGYSAQSYKSYDPVGELYYAALRYFRNLGNVASYTTLAGAGSSGTASTWLDGFPAITSDSVWKLASTDSAAYYGSPIMYSCQKNFILGIGDVNTWRDNNLPGSTINTYEPTAPAEVTADTTVNVKTATDMVGKLEGLSGSNTLGSIYFDQNATTCTTSSRCDSYYMAGLAYDAHTNDIRSDLSGSQTVNTYWMDVEENQVYRHKNQYWLAAKYGGFDLPTGFSPYATTNGTSTIPTANWYTSTDTLPNGATWNGSLTYSTDSTNSTDLRPDNYFPGNRPDAMQTGLTKAFSKISSELSSATSTAFSTTSPNVSSGTASYAATYDPKTWTGDVVGSSAAYDANGNPTLTPKWDARSLLESKGASNRVIVTCCTSTGAGLPFESSNLGTATLSSRTYYTSFSNVPGVSSQSAANYVAYLRGDRTQELANGGQYRTRSYLLGDIVGAKVNPVGPPNAPYYDLHNAGYNAYKKKYVSRKTVVYVGANDGMMHALDGTLPTGSTACSTCGTELFAYVPSFTYGNSSTAATTGLASLGNPSFTHHYMVDAKPLNFDLDFNKTSGSTATTSDWHSVIIGGLGKGGTGYYALDVTDPTAWTGETAVAGKVLWEFTDSRMGYSYGAPIVVKTAKYGWVAIFTSGYNNSDGIGYFFIVNAKTGALLATLATTEGSTAAPINLAQASAYIPDYTDFTADAVYAGDLQGNVWRLDLTGTGTYSQPTKIAKLAYTGNVAQPVTTRPLIEVDETTQKRYVLIGTGRLLADSDSSSTAIQTFYAIADGTGEAGKFYTSSTLPSGTSFPLTRDQFTANTNLLTGVSSAPLGWYFDLSADQTTSIAERVNVDATANAGIVAFAANLPNGQACSPSGSSRLFGVNFGTGQTVLQDSSGNLMTASTASAGVITDIAFQRVNGNLRVIAGDSTGATYAPGAKLVAATPLKRLNWREVPAQD
ncbi:MAG: pilus assembly protein [Proteobacteria bacterium]|nr:pilus assembly protein [Pseudomonadota bacterium]